MVRGIILLFTFMLSFSACAPQSTIESPGACPVTFPSQQTSSLPNTTDYEGRFWFGTPSLWTNLPSDGIWRGLPQEDDRFVQKTVFWSDGYMAIEEPNPDIKVSGHRLDAPSRTFSFSDATHGWDETGDFMLMGISIPTEGCWEVTTEYQNEQLTFVVDVVP